MEKRATDDIRASPTNASRKSNQQLNRPIISRPKKAELLDVLAKLKPAIAEVAQTNEEEAEQISRFVEASAHEAASKKERPESLERVLHKLKQSVEKFEASHPQVTAFVTEYSAVLSGLGI